MKKAATNAESALKPRKLKRGELKEALVERALEVGREGRLDEYTMRDFAKDLGVSPGAAYRHFKSREELFEEVARRFAKKFSKLIDETIPEDLSDRPVSEIFEHLCKANYFSAKMAGSDHEIYLLSLWSRNRIPETGASLQKDADLSFRYRMAFMTMLQKGAFKKPPTAPDILSFGLALSAIAGKIAANRLEETLLNLGLGSFLRNDLGVESLFDDASLKKLMETYTKTWLGYFGYDHEEWLRKDGRHPDQKSDPENSNG